jgi:hypothetical protein
MRIQNFYSLNLDVHEQLPASPNMVVLGSTNRLHRGAEYGGAAIVLVLIQQLLTHTWIDLIRSLRSRTKLEF